MNAPLSFRFYAPLSSRGVGFGRIRSFSSPFPKGSRAWFNRAFPPFERGDDQAHVVERRLVISTPKALHVLLQHEVVDMIHFVLAYSRQGKVRISKVRRNERGIDPRKGARREGERETSPKQPVERSERGQRWYTGTTKRTRVKGYRDPSSVKTKRIRC